MMLHEVWKSVLGFKRYYEVSDRGRVKSVQRWVENGFAGRIVRERILKLQPRKDGYLKCELSKHNKQYSKLVHHLVMEAFEGPRPITREIAHHDGNKANNYIENLRYAEHWENENDKRSHGRVCTSKYYGVSWYKRHKKWEASIFYGGKQRYIGHFDNEIDAAKAVNSYTLKHQLRRPINEV